MHFTIFLGFVVTAAALTCYNRVSDNLNYKPKKEDEVVCSTSVTQCIKLRVPKGTVGNSQDLVSYSCDTSDQCKAAKLQNKCFTEDGGTMCCCDSKLCNSSKKNVVLLGTVSLIVRYFL